VQIWETARTGHWTFGFLFSSPKYQLALHDLKSNTPSLPKCSHKEAFRLESMKLDRIEQTRIATLCPHFIVACKKEPELIDWKVQASFTLHTPSLRLVPFRQHCRRTPKVSDDVNRGTSNLLISRSDDVESLVLWTRRGSLLNAVNLYRKSRRLKRSPTKF
jgi:hypothetical protein